MRRKAKHAPVSETPSLETLQQLQQRLDDGYSRIEEAMARTDDVQSWEAFWIDLLRRYESEWESLPEVK